MVHPWMVGQLEILPQGQSTSETSEEIGSTVDDTVSMIYSLSYSYLCVDHSALPTFIKGLYFITTTKSNHFLVCNCNFYKLLCNCNL